MSYKLNALIVDDEDRSRNVLMTYISDYCPEVNISGFATNVLDAVKEINKLKPNIVFLDIEMPGGSGFELFEYFEKPDFLVVFVTAYENFAIRAFEVSALDYLTKPVKIKQLIKTVQKAKEQFNLKLYAEQIENLKSNLINDTVTKRIALPHTNGVQFFNIEDILFIEADGSYCKIKYDVNNETLASKKLSEIEKSINHPKLFKPHRSFIINLEHVKEFNKNEGDIIVMKCGTEIPLSRYRKDDFFEKIQLLE